METILRIIIVAGLISVAAGCKFAPVKKSGEPIEEAPPPVAEQPAETEKEKRYVIGEEASLDVSAINDPASPLAKRVIYFELDSSQVDEEGREIIGSHARFLAAHPEISIVLEGHADERGTREYNLALGERRAKAVKQLMVLQGVDPNQIQVISFGEERPVALDHNESAWRLNRRVEILYSGY